MAISSDKEFKAALAALDPGRQRQVAVRFVERVLALTDDPRIRSALDAAARPGIVDAELALATQAANSARVESFTRCGSDTGWRPQAGHFVAKAAVACVKPVEAGENPAWDAAMQARLARTCETVANGEGTDQSEANAQYRILEAFLNS